VNEAISVDMQSSDYQQIINLFANKGIIIFTNNGEYYIPANVFTPNDIYVQKISSIGINKYVEPIGLGNMNLFVDKNGMALNNINIATASGGIDLQTQNLSMLNANLIKDPVAIGIDYNNVNNEGNFIYIVNADGSLTIGNIELGNGNVSFTKMDFNTKPVKDIIVVDDKVYLVLKLGNIMSFEKFSDEFQTDNTLIKDAIVGQGGFLTFDGLEEYANITVQLYNDKHNYRTVCPQNGIITILPSQVDFPLTEFRDNIKIGFLFLCKLKSNDINIQGLTNSIKKRIAQAEIICSAETEADIYYNNVKLNGKVIEDDKKFLKLSAGGFSEKCNFEIMSSFGYMELKSILLTVNHP
jgi:hypothetical protein